MIKRGVQPKICKCGCWACDACDGIGEVRDERCAACDGVGMLKYCKLCAEYAGWLKSEKKEDIWTREHMEKEV